MEKVLKVEAVAVTQPLIKNNLDEILTPDEFIAFVARVSNPENQNNTLTATKLLKYLAKHSHWSPFEMADVCIEIETTRDIARQILRHRSFSFQEFSQRYADPTQSLGFVTREARLQDTKNRQNSIEIDKYIESTPDAARKTAATLREDFEAAQSALISTVSEMYEEFIKRGIAKEQARALLPEGLTVSRLYMKGSVRSWIHYCQLRMANGTQKEHREVATAAWAEVVKLFPSLSEVIITE